MKKYYLECLKVEFIYIHIIKALPTTKERYLVELMNLLIGSCFTSLSRLKQLQNQKNKDSPYQNLLESCVSKATVSLYESVRRLWKEYSALLTEIETSKMNIVFDVFKKLANSEERSIKDKFLSGIEKIDYTPIEKIRYTSKYFNENRSHIEKNG
jgi:5-methylthioribose kinase